MQKGKHTILTIVDNYDIFLLVMKMNFYKIKLRSMPEILFAHTFRTSDYKRESAVIRNIFEITYIVEGTIDFIRKNDNRTIYATQVHCDLYDQPYIAFINSMHQHSTVGLRMEYDFEVIDKNQVLELLKNSFSNKVVLPDTIIVPEFIEDTKFTERIRDRITNIIRLFALGTHDSILSATSQLFSAFSIITEAAISIAGGDVSYSDTAYCAKATAYIFKNADRQIAVKEIADELNISVGHLSRIFRSVTGDSIISYINKTKIERAKRLVMSGLRTGEIAELLGITDEKYFCRMFKKYVGVTVSQYRSSGT